MLACIRRRAAERGIEFRISLEDVRPLPTRCPILGVEIDYAPKGKRGYCQQSPSIDRVDPSLGYVPGNVWVISARANTIKNDATAFEHRAVAAAMEEQMRYQSMKRFSVTPGVSKPYRDGWDRIFGGKTSKLCTCVEQADIEKPCHCCGAHAGHACSHPAEEAAQKALALEDGK